MVNYCANPKCEKPLHYLREGRIFVFDVPDAPSVKRIDGARGRRMEHYWLCGDCAQTLIVKHSTAEGMELLARSPIRSRPVGPLHNMIADRVAS
jgi:hypothetical protein